MARAPPYNDRSSQMNDQYFGSTSNPRYNTFSSNYYQQQRPLPPPPSPQQQQQQQQYYYGSTQAFPSSYPNRNINQTEQNYYNIQPQHSAHRRQGTLNRPERQQSQRRRPMMRDVNAAPPAVRAGLS